MTLQFPARGPGGLPFSTAAVREQCGQFAHDTGFPLPGKHILMMCEAIDELRDRIAELQADV